MIFVTIEWTIGEGHMGHLLSQNKPRVIFSLGWHIDYDATLYRICSENTKKLVVTRSVSYLNDTPMFT